MIRHQNLIKQYGRFYDEGSDSFFFEYELTTAQLFLDFSGYRMGCFYDEGVYISFGIAE